MSTKVLSWWHVQGLKEGPSHDWWIVDWPLFLSERNARTCSRVYQRSSMIYTLCTAFWVPSRVIHIIRCSQHLESFSLILGWMGYMLDFVVDLVEDVDLDGSQSSESIVEPQYFARVSQRDVAVFEFGCPCLFRSPLLIHDSRHDQQWIALLLRSTSSSTLSMSLSWKERTRELSFASAVSRAATGRPVLSWWDSFCLQMNMFGSQLSQWVAPFFLKKRDLCSKKQHPFPENGTCFFPSNFLARLSINWDFWWRLRWHVHFFVKDFSSFQSNNFWNTMGWKCFLKDDCIRSKKWNVNPFRIARSMLTQNTASSSIRYASIVHDVVHSSQSFQDPVTFVHRINKQEEHCLSFPRILTFRY